jgi:hypothetical protein
VDGGESGTRPALYEGTVQSAGEEHQPWKAQVHWQWMETEGVLVAPLSPSLSGSASRFGLGWDLGFELGRRRDPIWMVWGWKRRDR